MDLYEALKAGSSKEDLVKTFQKDLDAAMARLKADKEKEKKAEENKKLLKELREFVASNLTDYLNMLSDKSNRYHYEDMVKCLENFEKQYQQSKQLDAWLKKAGYKPSNSYPSIEELLREVFENFQ